MNLCDDNRIITIEKAKQALIKGTNIEDSPEEMKVLDNILFRCWQMGWLDRYAPPRHFNAMPKVISERLAAGHGSNVPMQPNIPPMPSNTSNALDALADAYKARSNALKNTKKRETMSIEQEKMIVGSLPSLYPLQKFEEEAINALVSLPIEDDAISRKAAIELCDWYDNPSMREDLEKLRPVRFSADTISRKAAIKEVSRNITCKGWKDVARVVELMKIFADRIEQLPPAQPESDSGRWERHYSRPGVYADLYWHCSKCGYKTDYQYANVNHRYCPNCGRKMEGEVTDETD